MLSVTRKYQNTLTELVSSTKKYLSYRLAEKKPVIAVYPNSFPDQTGQRRSNSNFATFSTAVTQAPYVLLIKTLKSVARGHFFEVVERVGLDNLTKERQLIRSTRESFDDPQKLKPLMFAGLIFEGAIIGYETNTRSGGRGGKTFRA